MADNHLGYRYIEDEPISEHFTEDPVSHRVCGGLVEKLSRLSALASERWLIGIVLSCTPRLLVSALMQELHLLAGYIPATTTLTGACLLWERHYILRFVASWFKTFYIKNVLGFTSNIK